MPGTVTVALKHPHGLILRVFDRVKAQEPQPGGGVKDIDASRPRPTTVTLKGYLDKYSADLPPAAKGSSYALTHGVDKDFFDEWLRQNHDHDLVVNKLIFAHEKGDNVRAMTRDHADTRSGLEPVDPSKLKGRIRSFNKEEAA